MVLGTKAVCSTAVEQLYEYFQMTPFHQYLTQTQKKMEDKEYLFLLAWALNTPQYSSLLSLPESLPLELYQCTSALLLLVHPF